jgi:hypothetical protein
MVSLIGLFQEITEIVTHHHGFEYVDVVVDSAGVLVAVMILGWLRDVLVKWSFK